MAGGPKPDVFESANAVAVEGGALLVQCRERTTVGLVGFTLHTVAVYAPGDWVAAKSDDAGFVKDE